MESTSNTNQPKPFTGSVNAQETVPPWVNPPSSPAVPMPTFEKTEEEPSPNLPADGVKKSPFRFLIPILIFLGLGAGFWLILNKFIFPLLNKNQGQSTTPTPISQEKEINLVYWGLWEPEEVLKPVFEEYQQSHPQIKITYITQSHKDYRERLQSAFAESKGPDIFRFHSSWLPMLTKELAPAPATISEKINLKNNFFPVMSQNLEVNNQLFGVPLGFDCLSLYYNVKMFKDLNKTPPQTWEELRRTAVDLTITDNNKKIKTAGAALGTASNVDHFSDVLGLMMLQNGADLKKPTGELAEDALKFYTNFTLQDKVWDETLPNSVLAFSQGKVAMIFAPSWRAHEINLLNPSLEYKTVPVPQLPPGESIAWASYWAEGVAGKSKNQAAAWELLSFLTEKETLIKIYSQAKNIRKFGEPYPRIEMVSLLEEDPIVAAFVKQGQYAQSGFMSSNTSDNGLNDKVIKYYEDAINLVLKNQSVTSALNTVSLGVAQVLGQYGVK